AGVCRHHRQVARHHVSTTQLLRPNRNRVRSRSKPSRVHGRECSANVNVMNVGDVREPGSAVQRRESTVAAISPAPASHPSKPATISTPPRMEPVTRSQWQPAESAPSTEPYAKSKSAAP